MRIIINSPDLRSVSRYKFRGGRKKESHLPISRTIERDHTEPEKILLLSTNPRSFDESTTYVSSESLLDHSSDLLIYVSLEIHVDIWDEVFSSKNCFEFILWRARKKFLLRETIFQFVDIWYLSFRNGMSKHWTRVSVLYCFIKNENFRTRDGGGGFLFHI